MYENISITQARSDLKYIKDTYGPHKIFVVRFATMIY